MNAIYLISAVGLALAAGWLGGGLTVMWAHKERAIEERERIRLEILAEERRIQARMKACNKMTQTRNAVAEFMEETC